MKTAIAVAITVTFVSLSINAATIHVPADQPTIQAGIDAASTGDTVLVDSGLYYENVNLRGKAMLLTSNYLSSQDTIDILHTVIDGSMPSYLDSGHVVTLNSGEDSTTIINGFTIRNGIGSGVLCYGNIRATICNNFIHSNVPNHEFLGGSGIATGGTTPLNPACSPTIIGNRIYDNRCWNGGCGVGLFGGTAYIAENVFYHNRDTNKLDWTAVIGVHKAKATIIHNTFGTNAIDYISDSPDLFYTERMYVQDNVFYHNNDTSDSVFALSVKHRQPIYEEFSYNCFYGGFTDYFDSVPITGLLDTSYTNAQGDVCDSLFNIYLDPQMCNSAYDDYSVSSTSPCVLASSDTGIMGALEIGCNFAPIILNLQIDGDSLHLTDHAPLLSWSYWEPQGLTQASYELEVGDDSDWTFAELWATGEVFSQDSSISYSGGALEDGTWFFVRLRCKSLFAWSPWHETSFRMNSIPSIPSILSPTDDQVTDNTPTLWLQNSTDAEGDTITYDFFVVVDTLYGEPDPQEAFDVPEGEDSTDWQVPEPLEENKRYWWRARAHDGYEYSDWTDLFSASFFVNGTPEAPTAPQCNYPPDTSGLPVFNMLPTFIWSQANDPDPLDTVSYKLEIALDSNFNFVRTVDSLEDAQYTLVDSLEFQEQYWWRVTAFDNTGLSTVSGNIPNFWTWTLGDLDHSHDVNVADLTVMVDYLFKGGNVYPEFIADMDGDCDVNVVDLTYLVDYLFKAGLEPCVGCE